MELFAFIRKDLRSAKTVRRRFLTLAEMLIVVSLLSVAAGALYFSVRPILSKSYAEKEVGKVRLFIELAQSAAVFSGIGSQVTFTESAGGILVRFQPDFPLSSKYAKQEDFFLKELRMVRFVSKEGKVGERGALQITCLPDGTLREGEGFLQLSPSAEGQESSSVYLKLAMHTLPQLFRKNPFEERSLSVSGDAVYSAVSGLVP